MVTITQNVSDIHAKNGEKKIFHFGFKLVGINYQFCIDLVTLHENLCDGEEWKIIFLYTGFGYIKFNF